MDILDIDWSPSGLLASGSIDNKVIIWDIARGSNGALLSPFRVLDGHQSFVKGVSFDPMGRILATCSSDNTILLWRTETWEIANRLSKPLQGAPDSTMFRRMNFAPDGQSVRYHSVYILTVCVRVCLCVCVFLFN